MIIPQQRSNRSTGITGEFICSEDYAQLKFREHPVLKIDYASNNLLPTATARNSVIDLPSINLCITDGENQNLSPAAKRLLEWHF